MLRSMTGFSTGFITREKYDIILEIKSLNSRFFEFKLKGNDIVGKWESEIKQKIYERLNRGKIELYVKVIEKSAEDYNIFVNTELAKRIVHTLQNLLSELSINSEVSLRDLIAIGRFFEIEHISACEDIHKDLLELLDNTIDNLLKMMYEEGKKIEMDIEKSINTISSLLENIERLYPLNIERYKNALKEKLKEMVLESLYPTDEKALDNRALIETELYISKVAINEEIVRLKSHITQFEKILKESISDSRKLDFIAQEMFREINTISAKSVDYNIIEKAIDMKIEVEKIREHLRNTE